MIRQEKMVHCHKVNYRGWPNCFKLSNGLIELIVTTEVGPRILYCGLIDGNNLFYENTEDLGKTGGSAWRIFGGHRLWHAPEDPVRTYAADNFPVEIEIFKDDIRLTAPVETSQVQKTIEIRLDKTLPKVEINHKIQNCGAWTISLSAWALTVMRAGGMAILPHPQKVEFPGLLTPTHSLALWGYTRMNDPRWTWGEKYIFLRQDIRLAQPQKLGMLNSSRWAAYQIGDEVFIKQFNYQPGSNYPDQNCNFETFTNANILELESLGPVEQLSPGQSIEHLETWSLFRGVKPIKSEADVDQHLLPLIK
jgi:hypothetical protein